MKKNILLPIVLATLLFVGCDTDTTTQIKDSHINAVQDAKKAVDALVAKSKAIEKAQEVAMIVPKEKIVKKEDTVVVSDGEMIFKKCATCHGEDGKKSAFQKSEIIAGQSVEQLTKSINGYKAGTRDVSGMGNLMKGQVLDLSDFDIQSVAEYISTLK